MRASLYTLDNIVWTGAWNVGKRARVHTRRKRACKHIHKTPAEWMGDDSASNVWRKLRKTIDVYAREVAHTPNTRTTRLFTVANFEKLICLHALVPRHV